MITADAISFKMLKSADLHNRSVESDGAVRTGPSGTDIAANLNRKQIHTLN